MNRIPIALLGSAMLCAMAWLVGSEDVISAATWGTICVGVAALSVLWRDSLRGVLFTRRPLGSGPPVTSGISTTHIALAILILLLFAASRHPRDGLTAIPLELLAAGAAICAILYVMKCLRKRRGRSPSPVTPRRSRSSWTPPSSPDLKKPDLSDDMRKTRPMPPM